MKAVIRSITKQYCSHNVNAEGRDRVHVCTEVDFVDDNGNLALTQTYAHLPEDFDGSVFQRQADVMQADIEDLKRREEHLKRVAEEEAPADDAIRKFKLEFGDKIVLREDIKNV